MEVKPRTVRKEFFQLKDVQSQERFFEETSLTDKLTSSFSENRNKFKLGDSVLQEYLEMKTKLKIFLKNNKCRVLGPTVEAKLEEI